MLNKLTPEKFEKLVLDFTRLNIKNSKVLKGIIVLVCYFLFSHLTTAIRLLPTVASDKLRRFLTKLRGLEPCIHQKGSENRKCQTVPPFFYYFWTKMGFRPFIFIKIWKFSTMVLPKKSCLILISCLILKIKEKWRNISSLLTLFDRYRVPPPPFDRF